MQSDIYRLPDIDFIGGSTETLKFYLQRLNGQSFDAYQAEVNFAITNYGHRSETPIISKMATLERNNDDTYSIAVVKLDVIDTLNLEGKFVYQLIIKDSFGNVEIPYQGYLYIINNINKSFLMN